MGEFLRRRWLVIALLGLVVIGLKAPATLDWSLRSLPAELLAGLAIALASIRVQHEEFAPTTARPNMLGGILLIGLLLPILLASLIGWFAPLHTRLGFWILGVVPPTIVAAPVWTRLSGGDGRLTLRAVYGLSWLSPLVFLLAPQALPSISWMELSVTFGILLLAGGLASGIGPLVVRQRSVRPLSRRAVFVSAFGSRLCVLLLLVKLALATRAQLPEANVPMRTEWILESAGLALVLHGLLLLVGFAVARCLGTFATGLAGAWICGQRSFVLAALLTARHAAQAPLAVFPVVLYYFMQLLIDPPLVERLYYRFSHRPEFAVAELHRELDPTETPTT